MSSANEVLFGLDTFGDMTNDLAGNPISAGQVIRNLVDQAVLADELGLHAINIGEHHRDDFAVSAPDTVLAGIATRTKRITLGTGVTVLSSEDPVRVYQRFATIDGLSNGRAGSPPVEVHSPNRSHYLATIFRSTTSCSRKNSNCWFSS